MYVKMNDSKAACLSLPVFAVSIRRLWIGNWSTNLRLQTEIRSSNLQVENCYSDFEDWKSEVESSNSKNNYRYLLLNYPKMKVCIHNENQVKSMYVTLPAINVSFVCSSPCPSDQNDNFYWALAFQDENVGQIGKL